MEQPGADVEALRLARREARLKLDHEIGLVYETDDTALRTVRTAVVVLGVLVSAGGIAGVDDIVRLPVAALALFIVGSGCLLASVFTGIGVLAVSDFAFGVASTTIDHTVAAVDSEETYLEHLLESYREWVTQMVRVREKNSERLLVVLASFFLGILCIAAAGGLIVASIVV